MLKYQNQNTDITVLEGIKEYREYLVQNNKDKLQDFEGSQLIRDHDATHVIFGLDTTIEQESMLDTWVLWGTEFKWKYLLSYIGKQELKELQKKLFKEIGVLKLIYTALKIVPIKLKIILRALKMKKKWPFIAPKNLLEKKICDVRAEYGIIILSKEERHVKNPLEWSGSIKAN
mgnify:FL=1